MEEATVWTPTAIQIITWMGAVILIGGYLMYLKGSFQRKVIGKVWCQFITREGNELNKLYPAEGGKVEIPMSKNSKGKLFLIDTDSTHIADYPAGFPRFLQTKAKKVILHTGLWEPLSRKPATRQWDNMEPEQVKTAIMTENPIATPEYIFNLKNEMFSELAVAYSRDMKELQEQLRKQANPKVLYIIIGAIGLATIGIAYFLYQNLPEILEGIKAIRAGLGV